MGWGFVADDAEGMAVDGSEVAELVLVVHPDDARVAVVAAGADVAPEAEVDHYNGSRNQRISPSPPIRSILNPL